MHTVVPAAVAVVDGKAGFGRQQEDFVTDPARLDAATHTAAALANKEDSGEKLKQIVQSIFLACVKPHWICLSASDFSRGPWQSLLL